MIRSFINSLLVLPLIIILFTSCEKGDTGTTPVPINGRTVLVYMIADNNMSSMSDSNIRRILSGSTSKTLSNGNLLVYVDNNKGVPTLIQIKIENGVSVRKLVKEYPEQNSASSEVMSKVIDDVMTTFPSEDYGLILWSHGGGWLPLDYYNQTSSALQQGVAASVYNLNSQRIDRDPFAEMYPETRFFGIDGSASMDLDDLSKAIPDNKFNFIIFDACYMGDIETTYVLRNKCKYLIASPTEVLLEGYPYDLIIEDLLKRDIDHKAICETYFDYYNSKSANPYATVSLIKMSEVEAFADVMKRIVKDKGATIENISLNGIQTFDRNRIHTKFDMTEYVKQIASKSEMEEYSSKLSALIPYKAATESFINLKINTYSGMATYIPVNSLSNINEAYKKQEWTKRIY